MSSIPSRTHCSPGGSRTLRISLLRRTRMPFRHQAICYTVFRTGLIYRTEPTLSYCAAFIDRGRANNLRIKRPELSWLVCGDGTIRTYNSLRTRRGVYGSPCSPNLRYRCHMLIFSPDMISVSCTVQTYSHALCRLHTWTLPRHHIFAHFPVFPNILSPLDGVGETNGPIPIKGTNLHVPLSCPCGTLSRRQDSNLHLPGS